MEPLGAKPGFFSFEAGDVFGYTFQGGGGFGDPIERDPASLRQDVEDEIVTPRLAESVYGVVVSDLTVDAAATEERRAVIRVERLGEAPTKIAAESFGDGEMVVEVDHALGIDAEGEIRCRCGTGLSGVGENWKDGARTRVVEHEAHGRRLRLHEELEIREHICPGCGTLVESELALKGAPNLFTIDVDPDLPGGAAA